MRFNEKINLDNILSKQYLIEQGYKWIILYNYDSVKVDEIQNIKLNKNDILEARIFSEEKEIHIFKKDGSFKAVEFIEDNEKPIDRSHLIINDKFGKFKKIGVKDYLEYDSDNQAYISYTRPYNLE